MGPRTPTGRTPCFGNWRSGSPQPGSPKYYEVETRWQEVGESIAPGSRISLSADLAGQDVGAAESVLKIRWEDI